MTASGARPLVSAHRHGNRVESLLLAQHRGVAFVELDVHLFHGRLEVRHEKSLGPLPLLWDRWHWPRWTPAAQRVELSEVLSRAAPETAFHIDLKGWTPRLSRKVRSAMQGRIYLASGRVWWLLGPFERLEDVLVVRSIGARWQRWLYRLGRGRWSSGGVAIRSDLLSPAVARRLKAQAAPLIVWKVGSAAHARALASMGADIVVVDDLDIAEGI